MQSLDADSYPIVVHEYAHLIMWHAGATYPAWLNEGLAEFCDRFGFFTAKYREPRPESTFSVRRIEPFEARLMTATLLAGLPAREDAARAAYETLLQERPDDVGVLEARGYFEFRLGHRLEAQPFLMKAVEAKSRSPIIYRLASSLAESDEERETLLGAAIAIDPIDVETRLMYPHALRASRKTEEALAALAPISRLTPEQAFPFFELRAMLSAQLDRLDDAQAAAASARHHASAGLQAKAADRLVEAINSYADRRSAADRLIREAGEARDDSAAEPAQPAAAPSASGRNDLLDDDSGPDSLTRLCGRAARDARHDGGRRSAACHRRSARHPPAGLSTSIRGRWRRRRVAERVNRRAYDGASHPQTVNRAGRLSPPAPEGRSCLAFSDGSSLV